MLIPDAAPPLAVYCSPYGGLGLKTKTFLASRARIDGLLRAADDVVQTGAELEVCEPASRELVERLAGSFDRNTAMRSGGRGHDLALAVAETAHPHDEVAAEAWRRFGAPDGSAGHQEKTGFWIAWKWTSEDPAKAAAALDAWSPFAAAHDQRMMNDYATAVGARGTWTLRLRTADGRVVADPYPPSQITAHLRGRHASAVLDLVLPHAAATPAFLADYAAVNRAAGITIPLGGYKLSAPKKKGGGRALKRLPPA
jgi:hypothetical protein